MQVNNSVSGRRSPWQSLRDAWQLARPFWLSEQKWPAISLLVIVIAINLLVVYVNVLFNSWNNAFYNSLQELDKVTFFKLLIRFTYLAFFYIACRVLGYYFNKTLEIRWRRWLTAYYMDNWLAHNAYYKMRFINHAVDNPDQRISEDVNSFISTSLSLALGLISNVVTLLSFVFILWHISGPLSFMLAHQKIVIPGYMVWVALIYAVAGTWITFIIGRPLIRLNFKQEQVEANFRYGLMRVREYGESIALYNGEAQEKTNLKQRFNEVVDNFVAIIYREMKLTIFNSGYSQIANIFPILVAAPRFFAKAISLGALMQISNAFGQVQGALSYFIDAYGSLASWRAVMDRLGGFRASLAMASDLQPLAKQPGQDYYLQVSNLNLRLPEQASNLLSGINFALQPGDRLLIKGRSGCGKTTFLRTLAGLWPFADGVIAEKPGCSQLFIAQRPYIPVMSLRSAICYPRQTDLPSDAELQAILRDCQLPHLQDKLDVAGEWDKTLSLGEQQRIAFARILVNQPDVVYLDEVSSALDEELEAELYQLICTRLPHSVIVSIGHRSSLSQWHNQELNFNQLQSA